MLKREPDYVPEETSHSTPKSARTEDQRYRLRHGLTVNRMENCATILQAGRVRVNSLRRQSIDDLGKGLARRLG
jgi:gamma-glutamyl-gamma-aminobutyrate hydrolase PuuD